MKIKLLSVLRLSPEKGIPETALRMETEMRYSITVGDMEFRDALQELKRKGYVTEREDDLTGDRIWQIAAPQPGAKNA